MSKVCILVLCGLPACGKTNLVEKLRKAKIHSLFVEDINIREEKLCNSVQWVIISYDTLLPTDVEKVLIHETSNSKEASKWKSYREQIFECVSAFISYASSNTDGIFKPISVDTHLWEQFQQLLANNDFERGTPSVIVIDDNMYYKSMRYKYLQLARQYVVGFCQIYVNCTLEETLERNRRRKKNIVLDEVILNMADKFEIPDPLENTWEKYSLTYDANDKIEDRVEDIRKMLQAAMCDPPLPCLDLKSEEQESSRQACSKNHIHQADQILRKLVGDSMKKQNGQTIEKLQLARKGVLTNLKSGMSLPEEMDPTDAARNPKSKFHIFVAMLFENMLKTS